MKPDVKSNEERSLMVWEIAVTASSDPFTAGKTPNDKEAKPRTRGKMVFFTVISGFSFSERRGGEIIMLITNVQAKLLDFFIIECIYSKTQKINA